MTKEMDTKQELVPYNTGDIDFAKSNFIIGAKYRSSLVENKLMAIALAKINTGHEENDSGLWVVELKAAELKRLLGNKSGSFYQRLDPIAREMTGKTIGMSDPEKQSFEYYAMVVTAKYDDSVLTIKFNPDLKKYIRNIKQNFTKFRLSTLLDFNSTFTFRLYELLKSKCYTVNREKVSEYVVPFSVAELKLELGVVNANADNVKKVLHGSGNPDYDKAVNIAKEKTFEAWSDFRKRVIDIPIEEINRKTEMNISYDVVKEGRGGKVTTIIFHIQIRDVETMHVEELTEEQIADFLDELPAVLGFNAKYSEMKSIAEAAAYDMDKVRDAVIAMNNQGVDVRNKVGYIITAIKEKYILTSGRQARNKRVNKYVEIESHDYDFDVIEQELDNVNGLLSDDVELIEFE